jgi:acyl-CoA synthetase (AMP-forming)/AMP-acid ligase II
VIISGPRHVSHGELLDRAARVASGFQALGCGEGSSIALCVADCAVFGIPDDEFGERVCAIIQPHSGVALESDDVRVFLEGRLAKYKLPRHIEFRTELPREDSGKIFKRKLRDPFWMHSGRQI